MIPDPFLGFLSVGAIVRPVNAAASRLVVAVDLGPGSTS
jgi:hypothetical protein